MFINVSVNTSNGRKVVGSIDLREESLESKEAWAEEHSNSFFLQQVKVARKLRDALESGDVANGATLDLQCTLSIPGSAAADFDIEL